MFVPNFVFVAVLAASAAQLGILRCVQGQWIISDEDVAYGDPEGQLLAVDENIWPDQVKETMVEDKDKTTTPQPDFTTRHAPDDDDDDDDEEGIDLAVWKIALVVVILLLSVVGSLSMAYYLCVWRGGRFYYQPHKLVSV